MTFHKKLYGNRYVNNLIAQLRGQRYNDRPFAFERGDELYTHITGAICLPQFDRSGFLCTVGVNETDKTFQLIEEYESEDEISLVDRARSIQKDYGKGVLGIWWGNAEHLTSLINKDEKREDFVIITHPPDFSEPDAFQIYHTQLMLSLKKAAKRLYFNNCEILHTELVTFIKDKRASLNDNPAVAMLGWLVHTLLTYKPWKQAIERIKIFSTDLEGIRMKDDYENKEALYNVIYK